ncbi:MAG TPA: hypothetical protein VIC71_00505 [Gammaproteobacteria bacterium]|jgi:hypothetical protein
MNRYVALIALGVSSVALAQLPSFEEVDKNADGGIDRSEAAAVEGLDFATADTNRDARIDRAEYAALSD